ncbi:hypothetical protein Angca_009837, partial [Angiostrongylus cantonensis]
FLFTDQTFDGKNVVIFYEHSFGLYPYFKGHNKIHPVNGGLPQKTNMTAHLLEVEKNIEKLMPDKDFNGFAVIDIEEWRPLFRQHYRNVKQVYQEASIALVKSKNKRLSDDEARQEAEKEFNDAAREFIVETIQKAKQMRPKALWGLYGFPVCNYNAGQLKNDYSCWQLYKGFNDEMMYIYNIVDALYPSIYLGFPASSKQRFRYVQAILEETLRIAKKRQPPLPIYPYSKFENDPLNKLDSFYNKPDRCSTIDQPADLGIDGLILWSSSANMADRCDKIETYIENELGPDIKRVIQRRKDCEEWNKCSANQKCALKTSTTTPPYLYSAICPSTTKDPTAHDDYECI